MMIPGLLPMAERTLRDAGLIAGALGAISGTVCLFSLRRHRIRLEQAREELHIALCRQQNEYQDGIGQVSRAVEFLEASSQSSQEALRGGLTPSLRSHAMQLLRSGMSPDAAAAAAGMARRDLDLIATVSRILASFQ